MPYILETVDGQVRGAPDGADRRRARLRRGRRTSAHRAPSPAGLADDAPRVRRPQLDSAIVYGMSLYDAGKSKVAVAQSALESASDNLRAARASVSSSLQTDTLKTFYQAREAYTKQLESYLSTLKKEGKKLPATISEMIFKNVEYLKDLIVSLKDQPTVGPYISGASEYYASSVQPYVETAITKVQPYVDTAMTNVSPYLPKVAKVA